MARRRGHPDTSTPAKPRLVVPISDWPPAHRALWDAETAPRTGRLARAKHADTLRPLSLRNARRSWGAFLTVLSAAGIDTTTVAPSDLVTPDHVARFVDTLAARGNVANSIKVRLFDLRVALHIIQPGQNFDWVTRPGDVSINDWFEHEPARKEAIDPRTLTQLGRDLIARAEAMQADADAQPKTKAAVSKGDEDILRTYRDGLICLLLAALPIRIGTLSLMRLEANVVTVGEQIMFRFTGAETKNSKPIECALPDHLKTVFRHYLEVIRPRMVHDEGDVWFWRHPRQGGQRFCYDGIMQMFRRLTERQLGTAHGTHVSRHGMATALADLAPERPGLAATVLGVGENVVARHYRHATMLHAARLVTDLLEEERDELRLRARTRFGHADRNNYQKMT
ncbi:hypothetical protein [Acidiphilium sp.]|uniref:hypothetical protein n=1 Tax=Acidiphilium sp. TaxID=527 RepID=UPI003CFC0116